MDTNPAGGSLVLMLLLLLAMVGCTGLPGTATKPVGVGPQAPVAASPAP